MISIPTNDLALIVYDFDGVMTDNKVYVDQNGTEMVQCNRGDGLGINIIKKLTIPQIILSTEKNHVVAKRAEKVGIPVIHGVADKASTLVGYCRENNVGMEKVLYVGNDTNDLEVMKLIGFPICPQDSHNAIKSISIYVTNAKGGEGVIREIADILTASNN